MKPTYNELMAEAIGETRKKAIKTIMTRRRVSFEKARKIQARAINGKN